MKLFCHCFLFWTLIICADSKTGSQEEGTTSLGINFVFVFPLFAYNINQVNETALEMYVLITNQDSYDGINNVYLNMPNNTVISYQLEPGESRQIVFKNASFLVYDDTTRNIFILSSDYKISVHAGIKYNNVGDSFLVLPTHMLDTHYIITTAGNNTNAVNQIIIIPQQGYPAMVSHPSCSNTATINKNVSYPATYVYSCSPDLSGHVITSNTSVAVMSGLISYDLDDKFGTEMLIPDKYWGTDFLLTNLTNAESSLFKIVASHNLTLIYNDCEPTLEILNLGEWTTFCQNSGAHTYIESTSPISIFQIPSNNDDKLSMYIQIPPVTNFNSFTHLQFSFPNLTSVANYATIQQIGPNCLTINGKLLQMSNSLFDVIYSRYYTVLAGGVFCLQFNAADVTSSMDLGCGAPYLVYYSMIQYGISQSSLVYAHVTAISLHAAYVDNIRLDRVCKYSTSTGLPTRQTTSSLGSTRRLSTQRSTTTKYSANSTAPPLWTTTASAISTIIDELANTTIANVTDVTDALTILNDTLAQANHTGYPLSPKDLKNIADILCNCSVIPGLPDQDFYLYMDCYNEVLNTNIQTIRDAQAIYNASLYYLACLQYMTSNTVNSSLVYNNNNVAAGNLDTNCSNIDITDTSAIAFVQYTNLTVELISNLTAWSLNSDTTSAFAILTAASLCNSEWSQKRIVRNDFVLYRGQQFFGSKANNYSVNDSGIDGCTVQRSPQTDYVVTVKILTNVTESSVQLTQPISYGFTVDKTDQVQKLQSILRFISVKLNTLFQSLHSKIVCGYWGLEWNTTGCYLKEVQGDMFICQCTHLTDFSLLVDSSATDPALCDETLQTLGIVVTALSSAGLLGTLVLTVIRKVEFLSKLAFLKIFFDNNRKTKSVVSDTLMVTLLLFYILFAILADSRITNISALGCNVSGAVLYTILFATMFFAAFAGLTFFKVYYIVFRHDVLNVITSKLFIIGVSLGVPTLITIILWFSFNPFFVRNDGFCWINPKFVLYAIVIPTSILLIGDIAITGLLIKGFFFTGNNSIQSAKGRKKMLIKKVLVLVTVQLILACPWIFEYFTIGTPEVTAFHYLFTLTNGTQGIWLSVIYMYSFFKLTKKARKAKKPGTINSQLGDSVRTQATPDMLDNRKFANGLPRKSEPVSILKSSKSENSFGAVSLSSSRKSEATLTYDKNPPAYLYANGGDLDKNVVTTFDKKPDNEIATASAPIVIPRPLNINAISLASSNKSEGRISYDKNSHAKLKANGAVNKKVVLVSDKKTDSGVEARNVRTKLSLDGSAPKKHAPNLEKKSDSYYDLLHGSRQLGNSPNKT